MSICKDGWPEGCNEDMYDNPCCPLALLYGGDGSICGCELRIWNRLYDDVGFEYPPNSCPHAPALKKIAEDPKYYKLVAVPVDAREHNRNCYYNGEPATHRSIIWFDDRTIKEGE